ncbi:hypothetical protein V7S43_014294 [Phytophthora oleae]|uniref:Uncharacterized protein n=1 Tax=Phytophthora oleae TaxID=2107226 RepID=A0ABD3F153_9STRA
MTLSTSAEQRQKLLTSPQPCAFTHIRSIGRIDDVNSKTTASLTAAAAEVLKLPVGRFFLNLDDVKGINWGLAGNTLGYL